MSQEVSRELREYATAVILDHARDIEPLSIREMADEHLGREISDAEAEQVMDMIIRADITIAIPPPEGAADTAPPDEAAIQAGYRAAAAVFRVAYDTQAREERSQAGLRWVQLLRHGSDAWQADLTADAARTVARHVTCRLGLDVQPRQITADEIAAAIQHGLETVL